MTDELIQYQKENNSYISSLEELKTSVLLKKELFQQIQNEESKLIRKIAGWFA